MTRNLLTVKDARNNTTMYTYNNMDRLETRQDALLAIQSFVYDGNGNVIQATDRRGKVTTYTYDELDRPSFIGFGTMPGPTYESSTTLTYDSADRMTGAVDSASGSVTRAYDDLDRLTSETTSLGVVTYGYDNAGRRTSTIVTGQPAITYTYDDADRLTQIIQGAATVSLTYDAGGRRKSLTLPSGITTNYSYNAASELTELVYQSGFTTLGNLTYSYDSLGRRESQGGTFAQVTLPAVLSTATYNENNQLTAWSGVAHTYDANGNLINDGTRTYTWNARNQLSSISGGVSASFQYDAFGRRTSKSIGGIGSSYLYDGANVIQEFSGATPTASILSGGIDEIFVRTDVTGASLYLMDALGSPIALADSSGIQTTYGYGPFGTTITGGAATTNSYQFTGRENDGTGLLYYRARYYNPVLQRFVSEDPIGFADGLNSYEYSRNNPVQFRDPLGLQSRGVGVNGSLGLGFGVIGGATLTHVSNGDLGLQVTVGPVAVAGGTASVTLGPQFSNAQSLDDLGGWFADLGASGGELGVLGGDLFAGVGKNGNLIYGGQAGAGIGAKWFPPLEPVEMHGGATYTFLWKFGNTKSWEQILDFASQLYWIHRAMHRRKP
jgi:RHS repeat-associated protein